MNFFSSSILLAATLLAADKPATRIGDFNIMMLQQVSVRNELKVTPAQAKALDKVIYDMYGRFSKRIKQDNEEHADEIQRRREAGLPPSIAHPMNHGEVEQGNAEVVKILTKPQLRRLAEISLQREGIRVFTKPKMADALNLDPDTVDLIQEVFADYDSRQSVLVDAYNKGPAGKSLAADRAYKKEVARINSEQSALDRETEVRVWKLLSKKQRAKYRAMLGSPFDPKASEASVPVVTTAPNSTAATPESSK